jgi:DNA-binding transcriptional ArsR family regulator
MKQNYDSECEICKILSNANRLKILMCLNKDGTTVTDIMKKTKLPQSVVSQHLSMMKLRDVLYTERDGKYIIYKIKYPEVLEAFNIIDNVNKKMKIKLFKDGQVIDEFIGLRPKESLKAQLQSSLS